MAKPATLGRQQHLWLLAAASAVLAPLTVDLPKGLALGTSLILLWRAASLWRPVPVPGHGLLTLLALGGAVAIAAHYRTLFGRDPGVALLLLLLALKLMEAKSGRDGHAAVLISYFLMLCQFPYAQSIASAVMTLMAVVLTTTALVLINHPRRSAPGALRLSAQMLAQASLFMLLLFMLFPRIPGPLWGLPADAYAGLTGLSETMTPGSISQLSRSDAIAFRVEFSTKQPAQDTLYWRGPVLTGFDGRTWTAGRVPAGSTLPYATAGTVSDYTVTLEPHDKLWLFALEFPGAIPSDGLMTADYQLLAKAPVRTRLRYAMRSYSGVIAGRDESPERLRQARQLPAGTNPRGRLLAQAWRAELGGDGPAIVRRMLDYYRNGHFSYTLDPPLLGANSMDEFLFDSRRGFCEHFAASFVFMMRAAGLPARVVTGYQGGEINPVDKTLTVRQSDAHAWAEVWSKDLGWRRVDPTAAIAPTRVERSLAAALPEGEPLLARPAFLWLREIRFRWDALANAWNRGVLGYNPQRQRDFLAGLGIADQDWQRQVSALAVLGGLLLSAFAAWALLERGRNRDPLQDAWSRLSRKLAGRSTVRPGGQGSGLARRPWEGPHDYAQRISAALPNIAGEISIIAELYETMRYGPKTTIARTRMLQELNARIGRLSP